MLQVKPESNLKINFLKMTEQDIPLWFSWMEKPYVNDSWFSDGFETQDYIYTKINGNGYDYPYLIFLNDTPVGYIQCCDLYAYQLFCPQKKGIFLHEKPGTFSIDLFIAEEEYLNKGYGTQIITHFIEQIRNIFYVSLIYIDPAITNKRAIRCYEKAGFVFEKTDSNGFMEFYVMKKNCPHE